MPILDEPVECTAAVRNRRDVEQILPAVPQSLPQRQRLPVGLTVHQDLIRAGTVRAQMRRHIHRRDQFRRARRHHAGTEGSRHPVQEMKRVQVHHAQGRREALPGRVLCDGRARQEYAQSQRACEARTPPGTSPTSW